MRAHTRSEDGHVKRARFITGAAMLGGFVLLGLGVGLATGQPGFGIVIAVGAWLAAMSFIRTLRDLRWSGSVEGVADEVT